MNGSESSSALTPAFVGIDVAFRKNNRLPISICTKQGEKLIPLRLRGDKDLLPPRGRGNRIALQESHVEAFSAAVLEYLEAVERQRFLRIERIAIDAPRSYKVDGRPRRQCDKAMDERRISCFTTPSRTEFEAIIQKAERHLSQGGSESTLPHANQIWMLVGFSLFRTLNRAYECIEVYPQAIVAALGCSARHKSTTDGFTMQLQAIAQETGWHAGELQTELAKVGFGAKHDRLDAFMSAWLASLPENAREACGEAPDEAIWIPKLQPMSRYDV